MSVEDVVVIASIALNGALFGALVEGITSNRWIMPPRVRGRR